jgi:hypothetical protein
MSTAQILSIYTPVPSNMIKLVLVHQVVALYYHSSRKGSFGGQKRHKNESACRVLQQMQWRRKITEASEWTIERANY